MGRFDVDPALVRKLAALLDETGLHEIEYQKGEQRIRVARGGGVTVMPPVPTPPPDPTPPSPSDGPPPGAVISPMVGTAYIAAEPGGAPFVTVGDRVSVGQTLVVIEAMKVMNPITAPQSGTVTEILVGDGRPVEYGEVLMIVR